MRSLRHLAAHAAVVLTAASAFAIPALGRGSDITASVAPPIRFRPAQAPHGFTIVRTAGGVGCRDATLDEAVSASKRSSAEPLHFIKTERADKVASGLTIVLRATNQLEGFPAAKNAFIRAADEWESRIASVITVIVDVDFGPKDFGTPFDTDVIGSTDPQSLTGDGLVGNVRSALISHASSAAETSLYTLIPSSSIPSDIGSVTTTGGSSANLRALGLIGAVANPTTETNFGDPPSIGFNNEFNYDFDPTNGIDAGTTDFNAVVLHELGHVLGFDSDCGLREIQPSAPRSATVLDFFRFRPGITTGAFGSTNRIRFLVNGHHSNIIVLTNN